MLLSEANMTFFSRLSLLTIFLLAFNLSVPVFAEEIKLCSDEWFPINGGEEKDEPGYAMDMAKAVFLQENIDINYIEMSWDDAIKAAEAGKCDGIIGAVKEEAPNFVYPAQSIGMSDSKLYKKVENPYVYSDLASLKAVRVGVIEDYFYDDEFDDYVANNRGSKNVVVSSSKEGIEGLLWLLLFDRIDILIESSVVMEAKIKEKALMGKVVSAGVIGESMPIYIAFPPQNPKSKTRAELFSTGISELRKSGLLEKILQRYGLEDWIDEEKGLKH